VGVGSSNLLRSTSFHQGSLCSQTSLIFCFCGAVVGSYIPLAPELFEFSDGGLEVNFKLVVTVDAHLFNDLPHDHLLAHQRTAFKHIDPGEDSVVLFLDLFCRTVGVVYELLCRRNFAVQLFDLKLGLYDQFIQQFRVPNAFTLDCFMNFALVSKKANEKGKNAL